MTESVNQSYLDDTESRKKTLIDDYNLIRDVLCTQGGQRLLERIRALCADDTIMDYMNIPSDKVSQLALILRARKDIYIALRVFIDLSLDEYMQQFEMKRDIINNDVLAK